MRKKNGVSTPLLDEVVQLGVLQQHDRLTIDDLAGLDHR
jgi:hypothetical protein